MPADQIDYAQVLAAGDAEPTSGNPAEPTDLPPSEAIEILALRVRANLPAKHPDDAREPPRDIGIGVPEGTHRDNSKARTGLEVLRARKADLYEAECAADEPQPDTALYREDGRIKWLQEHGRKTGNGPPYCPRCGYGYRRKDRCAWCSERIGGAS